MQALLNVYTEFHRADGHVIWAHMDQWDGQHFNWAPGNLLSPLQKVSLDPEAGYVVELNLTAVFNCCRALVPHMIENGYGRIVLQIGGKDFTDDGARAVVAGLRPGQRVKIKVFRDDEEKTLSLTVGKRGE